MSAHVTAGAELALHLQRLRGPVQQAGRAASTQRHAAQRLTRSPEPHAARPGSSGGGGTTRGSHSRDASRTTASGSHSSDSGSSSDTSSSSGARGGSSSSGGSGDASTSSEGSDQRRARHSRGRGSSGERAQSRQAGHFKGPQRCGRCTACQQPWLDRPCMVLKQVSPVRAAAGTACVATAGIRRHQPPLNPQRRTSQAAERMPCAPRPPQKRALQQQPQERLPPALQLPPRFARPRNKHAAAQEELLQQAHARSVLLGRPDLSLPIQPLLAEAEAPSMVVRTPVEAARQLLSAAELAAAGGISLLPVGLSQQAAPACRLCGSCYHGTVRCPALGTARSEWRGRGSSAGGGADGSLAHALGGVQQGSSGAIALELRRLADQLLLQQQPQLQAGAVDACAFVAMAVVLEELAAAAVPAALGSGGAQGGG